MIRVLIVDDSPVKVARIREFLGSMLLLDGMELKEASNNYDAANLLRQGHFDLMILDIQLPNKPGEETKRDGGMALLQNLLTRPGLNRPAHIIGLTEYSDLVEIHKDYFTAKMWYLIKYSVSSDKWTLPLGQRLLHIADTNSRKYAQVLVSTLRSLQPWRFRS